MRYSTMIILLFLSFVSVYADYGCSNDYTSYSGQCYKVYSQLVTRTAAASQCKADGGFLASANNAFANSYIFGLGYATNLSSIWMGITCPDGWANNCVNDDGTRFGPYDSFGPNMPNKDSPCIYMSIRSNNNQKWYTYDCNNPLGFVCEVTQVTTPVPTTTTARPPSRKPRDCQKQNFFEGDIAIVFEQTTHAFGTQLEYAMHNFINFYLLTYPNNPYRMDGNITRILLVPYGDTEHYTVPKGYSGGPTSMEDIGDLLEEYDDYTNNAKENVADINAGLQYVLNIKDHGSRPGSVIIMGSDATYVQSSMASSKQLQQLGYNVFTINFHSLNDLSPLATDQYFSYKVVNESDYQFIAKSIGSYILDTTDCDTNAPTLPPTTPPTIEPIYNGNLAIVMQKNWPLDAHAYALNNFITYRLFFYPGSPYLLQKNETQMILVPYGLTSGIYTLNRYYQNGPKSIEDIADEIESFDATAKLWYSTNINITDGLSFVLNEATSFDNKTNVVILVGSSDQYVKAAMPTANKMKKQGYKIFTVSFNPDEDLSSLSSGPSYSYVRRTEADEVGIAKAIGHVLSNP